MWPQDKKNRVNVKVTHFQMLPSNEATSLTWPVLWYLLIHHGTVVATDGKLAWLGSQYTGSFVQALKGRIVIHILENRQHILALF